MTSLCMCISMSGTVALCCFFAPKVYIAVCQPYKNVRMRQSAVGRLVNQQMRFMRASAERNSITSSQITQQYGTVSPLIMKKSPSKCNVKSDNNGIICRSNNDGSHENSPLAKTTPFLRQSSNSMLHSDDELAKETIMYQNNAELFFEQLFVNYDVTFL
uniref:G_PROTEIN_RECEP_F3_4 domain-containing protein n=1 Tax=Elaeophora elaphi TaxID=1147741 RepID=A0A0R3RY77_9BILA